MTLRARHLWEQELCPFGARAEDIVLLDDSADPMHRVRYLDLFRGAANDARGLWPQAVIEFQGKPVLYVVDDLAAARVGSEALVRLRRLLAFRAGADHLAISAPGRLTIYPVTPATKKELSENTRAILTDGAGAPGLIPSLTFPPLLADPHEKKAKDYAAVAVHDLLYKLLTTTTLALVNQQMAHLDALSLVGRALFVRFLVDRRVLRDQDIERISGLTTAQCFADEASASRMSQWLDETFNGDFLPLPEGGSERWFRTLSSVVFDELSKILSRATPTGQLHLSWGDGWNDLLFDHIPVGILSQVYEDHAHTFDPVIADKTSVKYTPRHIAEYMVDEVFFALGDRAHRARVLDPAVGGGVFLVAAFRRLAAETWRAEGAPPGTRKLRDILYNQLRGFDISRQALRLSSLGLYLTAVELDPKPTPTRGLRFDRPLLGEVLVDVSGTNDRETYIGSLDGRGVGIAHRGRYDVVIGNPPWKSWSKTERVRESDIAAQVEKVEKTVASVIRDRLGDEEALAYTMTDRNPDLPFLWRAMEWAAPDGHIALTLHGRFLFKQSDAGKAARQTIFRAITVDGLLNGTALRDTEYWPGVRAPFCLLFARNRRPRVEDTFWFVSPELEKGLNNQGKLRIDEVSAVPVENTAVIQKPWLLKALSRGTMLDVRVLEQMERAAPESLLTYWEKQKWEKRKGQGFKVGGDSPTSQPKKPAKELWGLPMLRREADLPFLIEPRQLPLPLVPQGMTMQRARARTIYDQPLALVAEALPVTRDNPAAYISFEDIAFSESFTGFSCAGHPQGSRLARYLLLLFNSNLLQYYALLTSGKFGLERDAMLVDDLYQLPFRPLERLPLPLQEKLEPLSDMLIRRGPTMLEDVDAFIAEVYGLSRADREVVADTLDIAPPFAHTRAKAQSRPDERALFKYIERVQGILTPFLERRGRSSSIRIVRNVLTDPWIVLQVDSHQKGKQPNALRQDNAALAALVDAADSVAATRIIAVDSSTTLLIGIVAQYRYVTPSRARLLAIDLLQEHADVLEGKTKA